MKTLLLFVALLLPAILLAENITTLSGKKYTGVTITRVDPSGLSISHDDGLAKISFTDLPEELRTKYGYDPAKAAAAMKQEAEAAVQQREAGIQQRQAAAAQQKKALRDTIAKKTHTIREVETDQLSFLDKPFFLQGSIELSSYYNWGYGDAEPTHYSFELRSGGKKCHVYMERAKAAGLRKQLVDAGGSLKGFFSVILLKARYRDNGTGDLLLELLDYRPPLQ